MPLADFLEATPARILLIDIETSPDLGWYWDRWKKGNIIATEQDWYMLSAAWQWVGEKRIHFQGVNDDPNWTPGDTNDFALTATILELMNEADVIMAFNGLSFDVKSIQTRVLFHRLPPPSRFQVIDPLRILRKHFNLKSNSLKDVCRFLGVETPKGDSGGFSTWRGCMAGDEKAWRKMKAYNKADITAMSQVYERLIPWMNRPYPNQQVNLGHWAKKVVDPETGEWVKTCPACGSGPLRLEGMHRTAVSEFPTLRCDNCGAESRARYRLRQHTGGVHVR